MAEFLTTHSTAAAIENTILNSQKTLVLVSPYLQVSKAFMDRLIDANSRGTDIILIYGKDELKNDEGNQLSKLKNISLLYCENLHAKCYFNQDTMVITSMNMYEFSEKNNREMGVLISSKEDSEVFAAAKREIQSIVRTSQVQSLVKPSINKESKNVKTTRQKARTSQGTTKYTTSTKKLDFKTILRESFNTIFAGEKLDAYCIRCGDRIPFDTFRPLCDDCYEDWSDYRNPYYLECYCHSCGRKSKTAKDRPQCNSCYSRTRRF